MVLSNQTNNPCPASSHIDAAEMTDFCQGTCHLHGDGDCGKVQKQGSDGKIYEGRIKCTKCGTIFCRNGLWKKFGKLVEGKECDSWKCPLCTFDCCCKVNGQCTWELPMGMKHTHCHNFRSADRQRRKRQRTVHYSGHHDLGASLPNPVSGLPTGGGGSVLHPSTSNGFHGPAAMSDHTNAEVAAALQRHLSNSILAGLSHHLAPGGDLPTGLAGNDHGDPSPVMDKGGSNPETPSESPTSTATKLLAASSSTHQLSTSPSLLALLELYKSGTSSPIEKSLSDKLIAIATQDALLMRVVDDIMAWRTLYPHLCSKPPPPTTADYMTDVFALQEDETLLSSFRTNFLDSSTATRWDIRTPGSKPLDEDGKPAGSSVGSQEHPQDLHSVLGADYPSMYEGSFANTMSSLYHIQMTSQTNTSQPYASGLVTPPNGNDYHQPQRIGASAPQSTAAGAAAAAAAASSGSTHCGAAANRSFSVQDVLSGCQASPSS